ncbi:hypothetical protein M3I01_013085 [Marinomonas sp. RSW2]|uniref:Uncharacterized protein n=1 Tax=Marinomonas maritima TaxID=2940935 RepID=A0ABT5WG96_9GAMM|nr:hypothetical protein [Marinomonas maritima]MDE8603832.1 hypothetical protein [Marinomonas maritima]
MKKVSLFLVWIVCATLLYAFFWSRNLDYFPEFPEWVGRLVREMLPADTAVEDITVYYLLILSFLIVSVVSLLVVAWFKLVKSNSSMKKSSKNN